jgi:lysophospholipid acyltransferase (LPLAT)-like uncharacterized protein
MKNFWKSIALNFLPLVLDVYIKTLRIKIHDHPGEISNGIYIFWHRKMLIGWWIFKQKHCAALVSQSKDGDILNNVLSKWDFKVVRGSSSRGGKEALREITALVKKKYSAVITPDGPRGPSNEMKNGALIISNECRVPVIPVKILYHKKKILNKSWDRFEIPLPFSTCEIKFGNKYLYEKYVDDKELLELKKKISEEM